MKCPTCSHENLPSVKYCAECGARLTQHTDEPAPLDLASERRQLTVMFCDLVDSTRLSGALDPEDLRAVVLAYQEASGNVVAAYDGHVAQYLGDGILVYFGYPAAHEDSPQRAVRCALGIIEAVGYADYFLLVWDIVREAATRGIPVLASIPANDDIRRKSANYEIIGRPGTQWAPVFEDLASNVASAPPVRPRPLTQDQLLSLFSSEITGRDYVMQAATVADMLGRETVEKKTLEVVYDET
jgi:hypothetical protein